MKVRAAIIFQKDGLDEEAVRDMLEEDVKIVDEQDDELCWTDSDGDDHEDQVRIYVFECDLVEFIRVKLKWHCVTLDSTGEYILYPAA